MQITTKHSISTSTKRTRLLLQGLGFLVMSLAVTLLPSVTFAQTVSFSPATNFAVGTPPNRVAIGDLNGDGKPDLAVAKLSDNNITILLGNGTGSFTFAMDLIAVSQSRSV